jgi:hypothetical protein
MICYAAHTTGATNRAALRAARWGLLGSAAYRWRDSEWRCLADGGLGWALDNGAWSAFKAGTPFDGDAFRRAVAECGPVDWAVCPDVVGDADGTRRAIDQWLPWLERQVSRVLVAVQDGMTPTDVSLSPSVGVFVGGLDAWKEATMHTWSALARASGAWCHVGRVNSVRRLTMVRTADATSFDGSGPSRFSKHLAVMERGRSATAQLPMRFTDGF